MEYIKLGNSGIEVSRLCLGCMGFGDVASKMHAWTLDFKYDSTEETDKGISARICELAEKYGASMTRVTLAWHFAKGVASPIVGATKEKYLDDAAGAFGVKLTAEDVAYIDELYVPHRIVGAL